MCVRNLYQYCSFNGIFHQKLKTIYLFQLLFPAKRAAHMDKFGVEPNGL